MKNTLILATLALAIPSIAFAEGDDKKCKKGHDHKKAMLEKFDTDGDGKLDEAEKEAMKAAMQARRAELIAKYDADGDGKLNEAERKAARDAGEKLPHGKKGKKCKKGDKKAE